MYRILLELLKLVKPHQPHLPQTNVSSSVIELANEARLMKENSAKLKAVIDEWLKVLEDGNKKYAEMEAARKPCH
jgi:hypothetical protein